MQVTALVMNRQWLLGSQDLAVLPIDLPVLTGESRRAWIEKHLATLAALARRADLDLQTVRSAALVVAGGHLHSREQDCGGAIDEAAHAGRQVWVASPANPLDARKEETLRRAILAFVHGLSPPAVPVLIDCEIDVPLFSEAALDVRDFRVVEAPVEMAMRSSSLLQHRDGSLWAAAQYISDDDSRLQRYAARLYELACVPVAPPALLLQDDGSLRAAFRVPAALKGGLDGWNLPSVQESVLCGIGMDALLARQPDGYWTLGGMGLAQGRAWRLGMMQTLATAPPWEEGAHAVGTVWRPVDAAERFASRLRADRYPVPLRGIFLTRLNLADAADAVHRVLQLDDEALQSAWGGHALEDEARQERLVAALRGRRNALGSLSFLGRVGLPFYEHGTSPRDIRGEVVRKIVVASVDELTRPRPFAVHRAPAARPADGAPLAVSPHQPSGEALAAARALLQRPGALRHPINGGGVRLVYAIPGQPYLLKVNRRAAESIIRWRAKHGVGSLPPSVLAEGEAHAERLNFRHARMVQHLGGEHVYPECSFVVPEAVMPGALLRGLRDSPLREGDHALPLLCAVQRIFPYMDAPGTLEYRVPYAERSADFAPVALHYKGLLDRCVLNLSGIGVGTTSMAGFMEAHPRSTAQSFVEQCGREEPLRRLATAFFDNLITRYCPVTHEPIDLSGPRNGFWYLNERGERKVALLDMLYPDDRPILLNAEALMERFLRNEPLSRVELCDLTNAINFARAANFIAFELGIRSRVDLFPDPVMKHYVSRSFQKLFGIWHASQAIEVEALPDQPWGGF